MFDIAGIDDETQLANAVLFRAHEVVSIPVDEAVIDYRVISTETDTTGITNRGSCSSPRTASRSSASPPRSARRASSSSASTSRPSRSCAR